jgi:hypothetical protein
MGCVLDEGLLGMVSDGVDYGDGGTGRAVRRVLSTMMGYEVVVLRWWMDHTLEAFWIYDTSVYRQ